MVMSRTNVGKKGGTKECASADVQMREKYELERITRMKRRNADDYDF